SDNVGVIGVQFKLDGDDLGPEKTMSPYSIIWDSTKASSGAHTLTAVARDAAGNQGTSAPVNVDVRNNDGTDSIAPSISITVPSLNATVSGGSAEISATASDNVGVVGVQFKLDGVNLDSEKTSAPYTVRWNTSVVANGPHTIMAVARDAAGNQNSSSV